MTLTISTAVLWALCAAGVASAAVVLLTDDVMRLVLGLGAFMLIVAGLFLYYGHAFLAVAQLFLYVGGVLVLLLFAIMLVHRSPDGRPSLENRHDPLAAVVSLGVFALVVMFLWRVIPTLTGPVSPASTDAIGASLLGEYLPQFEVAGALLLAALAAVVAIMGGERE